MVPQYIDKNFKKKLGFATFVAVEGWALQMMLAYTFNSFLLSNVLYTIIGTVAAYFVADAVFTANASKKRRIILGALIILLTVAFTIAYMLLTLYFQKVQINSMMNGP